MQLVELRRVIDHELLLKRPDRYEELMEEWQLHKLKTYPEYWPVIEDRLALLLSYARWAPDPSNDLQGIPSPLG